MASSLNHFCTPCHEDDISVKAITWCGECEEFLCLDCDKHHSRFKQLKKHKRMTVENFDKLPLSLKSLTNRCAYHEGERFEFFCSFHAAPCCVKCLKENHRECRDLGPLSEVVGNIKTSAAMSNRERELNEVKNNFVTIKQHLKNVRRSLHRKRRQVYLTFRNSEIQLTSIWTRHKLKLFRS